MPSSKWTDHIVDVPQSVVELSKESPRVVYCNLRPSQRDRQNIGCDFDSQEFDDFLRTIKEPTLVAIHYQHYRPELFTVVVRLEPIKCWESCDGLPRLDCQKPGNWNHCPNLWGTFVLAIARVGDIIPTDVVPDADSKTFESIVRHHGLPTDLAHVGG